MARIFSVLRCHVVALGIAFVSVGSIPTSAASDTRTLEAAKAIFDTLPRDRQFAIQTLLAVTGYWPNVAGQKMGPKLFKAISDFERRAGRSPDGILDPVDYQALEREAAPVLTMWGLEPKRITGTSARVWVPAGLGLVETPDANGWFADAPAYQTIIYGFAVSGVSVPSQYVTLKLDLIDKGWTIEYDVVKPSFFVIFGDLGGKKIYVRMAAQGDGVAGFSIKFPGTGHAHGDRLAIVMSDLFRSEVELGIPRSVPRPITEPAVKAAPAPKPAVVATAPRAGKGDDKPNATLSSGTGFFVSPRSILTNAHVVEGCRDLFAGFDGRVVPSTVRAVDTSNDLAIVSVETDGTAIASLRSGVALGEPVAAFGFPLRGFLATSGTFTQGAITATAGLGDDTRYVQISTAVQPGNSGGPLVDMSGNVVGIVTAKANDIAVASATGGNFPQGLNFALRTSVATAFLEAHGVSFTPGSKGESLLPEDVAARAKGIAVALECRG